MDVVKQNGRGHLCGDVGGERRDLLVYVHEESVAFPAAHFFDCVVGDSVKVHGHSAAGAQAVGANEGCR